MGLGLGFLSYKCELALIAHYNFKENDKPLQVYLHYLRKFILDFSFLLLI